MSGSVVKIPEKSNRGILAKLHSLMSELDYIQKDKVNPHFKYSYASEKAIKEAVHPLLVKYKVLFFLKLVEVTKTGPVTGARFEAEFVDMESGEGVTVPCFGEGEDKSDKGYYKAVTGAIKYVLTSTFLIPTGDDPEDDRDNDDRPQQRSEQRQSMNATPTSTASARTITEGQQKRLWAIARDNGWQTKEVGELLSANGYEKTEQIRIDDYERIVAVLQGGTIKDDLPAEYQEAGRS